MSVEAAIAFLDRVTGEAGVFDRARAALEGVEDVEARAALSVRFAAELGLSFTAEEFLGALEQRYGKGELGDEALEQVAGGMFAASTMGGGICLAFPDVCKTPSPGGPVPMPYPNIGETDTTTTTKTTKTKL